MFSAMKMDSKNLRGEGAESVTYGQMRGTVLLRGVPFPHIILRRAVPFPRKF